MSKARFQILIVDDDVAFRDFLAISLMELGHEVLMVSHVVQGLNLARKIPFDLFIVDGMLPDGDGVSFISKIRAMHPKALIYFLSARPEFFTHPALIHKLQHKLRVDKSHKKPVDTGVFLLEVSALLSTHHKIEGFDVVDLIEVLEDDSFEQPAPGESRAKLPGESKATHMSSSFTPLPASAMAAPVIPASSASPNIAASPQAPGLPNTPGTSETLAPQRAVESWLAQQRGPLAQKINASLTELTQLCAASSSWTPESPTLKRALLLAHQLHGSAGVFGFPKVGQHCGEIEGLLQQLCDGKRVSALTDKVALCLDAAWSALPSEFR